MITALIRIRGKVNIKDRIEQTFKMLRLNKSYSCTLLPEDAVYEGMVRVVKDYSMYGPVSDEVLKELLKNRLKRKDGKRVSKELVNEVVKSLKKGRLLKDVEGVEPVLRLHPPRGGFRSKGLKKTVKQGGSKGVHESMDELLKKMM